MIFSILLIALVGLIAYFHWVQGLFGGIISMSLAILAALLALGFNESIVTSLLGGRMADYASGLVAASVFAAVYLGGRVVFDMFVPGNVQVPLYVDKVGGLFCGAIAGVCAVGTFAVAAQMLPFGPSILGYEVRETRTRNDVIVDNPRGGQRMNVAVFGELTEENPALTRGDLALLMPVDQWIVGLLNLQSAGGAFQGSRKLTDVHPNLLKELFISRLGVQTGASRSLLNIGTKQQVKLVGLFAPANLPQVDGEDPSVRTTGGGSDRSLDPTIRAGNDRFLLVARVAIAQDGADEDNFLRLSMSQIRLVIPGLSSAYPRGTLEHPSMVLINNRLDDPVLVNYKAGGEKVVDIVFDLEREFVLNGEGQLVMGENTNAIRPGRFLELKRFGRIDLSGATIIRGPIKTEESLANTIIRKKKVLDLVEARLTAADPAKKKPD
jgi:hypothetical protein